MVMTTSEALTASGVRALGCSAAMSMPFLGHDLDGDGVDLVSRL
jgi:hypothetical protein